MPRAAPKPTHVYTPTTDGGMDEYNSFDVPSPSNSLYYNMYADADQYLESHTSESQSPSGSLYDVPSGDYNGITHVYPSPERDEDDSQGSQGQTKPAAKRKRENRYKNAPPSVLSRRRAQNRASQRAYRERKDQRIKDLEQMLTDAKQRNDVLGQAYAELHSEYILLKTSQLKDQSGYPAEQQLAYPAMGMPTAGDGLDMDLFVYSDMQTGYTL